MKGLKHIFFDLDHTLYDYDRSATETLLEIYELLGIAKTGASDQQFLDAFHEVNGQLWIQYNEGSIDREYIKSQRFRKIFRVVGFDESKSEQASSYFLSHCSMKPYLMPDAKTALDYLFEKYKLHIITNGFQDSQGKKLSSAGITRYFDVVVTSECADSRKPHSRIFEYSLEQAGASKGNCIMIGDNPHTDIQGAFDFGLQTVFYDPSGQKKSLANYTVQSLTELIRLF